MSVHESLVSAKALIDAPDKWLKGAPGIGVAGEPGARFCSWAAVHEQPNLLGDTCVDRRQALARKIPFFWWLRHGLGQWPERNLIRYNDDPSTTHADIMTMFDRAIANAALIDSRQPETKETP